MRITGEQQRQAWIDRTAPPVERVREGVWSIPIDFHGSPVRCTFMYVVEGTDGAAVVIDPGWSSEHGWSQLEVGLAHAGLSFDAIVGIVPTHAHPDHLGMVAELAERTGAWVGMHPLEAASLDLIGTFEQTQGLDGDWLRGLGVPHEAVAGILLGEDSVRRLQRLARPTLPLEHDAILPLPGRTLRVVATPGHTPGHICIVDEDARLAFTGDHVLPRITPNVGMAPAGGNPRALVDYYASLERIAAWDDCEVCPAHEYRFAGLAERCADLRRHHEERSAEIVRELQASPGLSVWQLASRLSWARGWEGLDGLNLRAALAETATHLAWLSERDRALS